MVGAGVTAFVGTAVSSLEMVGEGVTASVGTGVATVGAGVTVRVGEGVTRGVGSGDWTLFVRSK